MSHVGEVKGGVAGGARVGSGLKEMTLEKLAKYYAALSAMFEDAPAGIFRDQLNFALKSLDFEVADRAKRKGVSVLSLQQEMGKIAGG